MSLNRQQIKEALNTCRCEKVVGGRQMLAFCSEISSLKKLGIGMAAIQPTYFFKIKKDYSPLFLKGKNFRVCEVGFFSS